jgi:hypothetical protein
VPLLLSGGTALPEGFRNRFEKALRTADFPVGTRKCAWFHSRCTPRRKGALVAALSVRKRKSYGPGTGWRTRLAPINGERR